MAETEFERLYTVNLRRGFLLAPRSRRAKRAVVELRRFVARHMKTDEEQVWIDNAVNEEIFARGMQKPPTRIRIRAVRFDDGLVEVRLPEA